MTPNKKSFILPLFMVAVGTGWLLTTLGVVPRVDWAWTLGLAVVGLLAFVLSGFDKVTVVIGPFFLIASLLSVLRQTDRLEWDIELPVLVIVAGLLLLVARLPSVPLPGWIEQSSQSPPKK